MRLFKREIRDWETWGEIFQSIDAFENLIRYIFEREKLDFYPIEHCTPGTNGVFKVGGYVVKIFFPKESGLDPEPDYKSELFGLRRAVSLGVPTSELIAFGEADDKYLFRYMILKYIDGVDLEKRKGELTCGEIEAIGAKLREMTDILNTPCEDFNGIDVLKDEGRYRRWRNYPVSFLEERLDYINSRDFGEFVYVHGDLNPDNMLIDKNNNIYIIDFADAVRAPVEYEHALIAAGWEFSKPFMRGYFGTLYDESPDKITEICFNGLLIHDFGGSIVKDIIADPAELTTLAAMKDKIYEKITRLL